MTEETFNPIESGLYIRQRKALLTLSMIIIAINMIGGKLKTEIDGSSSFILPFGVSFDISRPWLIDWLLAVALIYLIIRYKIFSKFVRSHVNKARSNSYRHYIHSMDDELPEFVPINGIEVSFKLFQWHYSASGYVNGITESIRENQPIPLKQTFIPTIKVELKLFKGTNAYSDYYSPFVMSWLAILSYLVKIWL